MEFRPLGKTDINVSVICLGTMTWGEQNSEAEAHAQIEAALTAGVNFIDTAEMYPVPPKPNTYSLTEQYIGSWLQQNPSKRKDIVLASKVVGPSEPMSEYIRPGGLHLDKKNITTAIEGSLKRLNTDYLDLYQLHWPDRSTNFFGQLGYHYQEDDPNGAALEESLTTLHELQQAGKIRAVGLSNETPWGTMQSLSLAEKRGWAPVASIQNPYNLLNRAFEVGLAEISHREQVGLLAYSPLAFGVLSGKYLNNQHPEGARLTLFSRFSRYNNTQAISATASYVEVAKQAGLSPCQMALAYVNSRPFVTSNIIGATTLGQLEENLSSADITLSANVLEAIESIHVQHPNPAP